MHNFALLPAGRLPGAHCREALASTSVSFLLQQREWCRADRRQQVRCRAAASTDASRASAKSRTAAPSSSAQHHLEEAGSGARAHHVQQDAADSAHLASDRHEVVPLQHSQHDDVAIDQAAAQHSQKGAGPAAAGSPNVDMDPAELFPDRHVTQWSPLLAAYFPFGCAIGVVRMALWVILLAVDSPLLTDNDTMIRVLYTILGIRVRWRGADSLPAGRHVIVSNHVTVGDLMVLYAAPRPYVHLITSKLPRRITQERKLLVDLHVAKHHRVKLRHASGETYCRLADSAAKPEPVHLFPEGGMTNGRGMMRFSRGFMRFGKDLPIVPAAMRAQAAFGISTHTLTSSFAANMFWFCFAPWVSLDITVLPPMRLREGEGNGYFVERVQKAIAAELSVPIADLTLQQKHKLH